MATTTDPSPLRIASAVPYGDLRGFSALFQAYLTGELEAYFVQPPFAPGALPEAARRAAAYPRDRAAIVDILRRQNREWQADEGVYRHLDLLSEDGTAALVTGQQLGLFGGPLYTLYKTLTAVALARRLTEAGQPTVPVFWLHGEDHDLAEIDHFTVLDGEAPVTLRYRHPEPDGENAGPVGRLVLSDDIVRVLDELEALLPVTTDRDTLLRELREAYVPGVTMTDAFARFFRTLFPTAGLVFLNPDDPALKKHLVALFQHDVRASANVAVQVAETSERLVAAGYHAQVHVTPTNLFWLSAHGRIAIDAEGETYRARGTEKVWTQEEILAEIAEQPETFSPNVLLRPLAQDTLVPTAAYVAGPGEIAYFAQFRVAYEAAGVPMPVIYPRASVTLVAHRARQLLARHALSLPELDAPFEQAFYHAADARLDDEAAQALAYFEGMLQTAVEGVRGPLGELDVTLRRSVEATRTRLVKEAHRLRTRAVRAEKRRRQDLGQAIERLQARLFPKGKGQERVLSMAFALAAYGYDLPQRLGAVLPIDTSAHYTVEL